MNIENMTYGQLRNIAISYKANDQQRMRDHWDLFVDFARDVEVAHGITGAALRESGDVVVVPDADFA